MTPVFLLLASAAIGQTTYSESAGYKPLPIAIPENDLKKKPDKNSKDATQSPPNIGGDITVTIPVAVLNNSGIFDSGLTKADVRVFVDENPELWRSGYGPLDVNFGPLPPEAQ